MEIFAFGVLAGVALMWCGASLGPVVARVIGHAPSLMNDEALIVKYLQAHGPSSVMSIRYGMKDLTRGEHDWVFRGDRRVFGALKRLEASGAVWSSTDTDGRRFGLTAPKALIHAD